MYIAKVYLCKQLMEARLYEDYEHFISDLTCGDGELYSHLPDDVKEKVDFKRPRIYSGCCDEIGFCTDFEYRYPENVLVYCGTIMTEEQSRRQVLDE